MRRVRDAKIVQLRFLWNPYRNKWTYRLRVGERSQRPGRGAVFKTAPVTLSKGEFVPDEKTVDRIAARLHEKLRSLLQEV